jgi:hypothetical protein
MSAGIEELHFPEGSGTTYLQAIDHLYHGSSNGEVLFKRFKFHDPIEWESLFHPSILHTITSFVSVPGIAAAFEGEVHAPACPCDYHKNDVKFETRNPPEWASTLGSLLSKDTCYGKGLRKDEALRLANAHLDLIHPSGRKLAAFSDRTWCSFFCDVAWDHTFIAWDEERIMSVLLLTDTD